jgi:RNA polymerase subunit RPABC4/transcription elongation factor Spt4
MKQCQVCLAHVELAAPTCPLCGEASWPELTEDAALVDDTDVTTTDASPQAKRGKRK